MSCKVSLPEKFSTNLSQLPKALPVVRSESNNTIQCDFPHELHIWVLSQSLLLCCSLQSGLVDSSPQSLFCALFDFLNRFVIASVYLEFFRKGRRKHYILCNWFNSSQFLYRIWSSETLINHVRNWNRTSGTSTSPEFISCIFKSAGNFWNFTFVIAGLQMRI